MICPCCRSPTAVPDLETVIFAREINGHALAVLEAVQRGRGMPVMMERIFDAMYADDPDGGPSRETMRITLHRAVDDLSERLVGTGYAIERIVGRGWRLVINA